MRSEQRRARRGARPPRVGRGIADKHPGQVLAETTPMEPREIGDDIRMSLLELQADTVVAVSSKPIIGGSTAAWCGCSVRACIAVVVAVGTCVAALALLGQHIVGAGSVVVRFREQLPPTSQLGGAMYFRPTVFRRRLSSLYLAADIDPNTQNNRGLPGCNTPTVYFSPECNESHDCDIAGAPASSSGRRTRYHVHSWFDLMRPAAELDADLNARKVTLCPGMYRYVRIEWAKYGGNRVDGCDGFDKNRRQPGTAVRCPFTIMWQGGSLGQPFYSTGGTSVSTIKLDPPVVVPKAWGLHTRIEIELEFSLLEAIAATPEECWGRHSSDRSAHKQAHATSCLCVGQAGPCLREPTFSARVVQRQDQGL